MQVDLLTSLKLRQLVDYFEEQPGVDKVIPISALKGKNLKDVEEWALSHLPEGPALYPKVCMPAWHPINASTYLMHCQALTVQSLNIKYSVLWTPSGFCERAP